MLPAHYFMEITRWQWTHCEPPINETSALRETCGECLYRGRNGCGCRCCWTTGTCLFSGPPIRPYPFRQEYGGERGARRGAAGNFATDPRSACVDLGPSTARRQLCGAELHPEPERIAR